MKILRVAAAWCVFTASGASAATPRWLGIKSPHFTVVTNSTEKAARRTAWQFEQIRQALQIIWPWARVEGGRPVTIFAVRDEATLKALGPQYWEGKRYRPTSFWVGDQDRTYIALRTDLPEPDDVGVNPYQTAYWSYVNLVFLRSLPARVPEWYSRGVTSVLSNTIVREKEVHVGRLMNDHLQRMREGASIPLAEFLAADRKSKYLTRDADSWQFDSQSWAFVHFLMFGNKAENSGKLDRFTQLLLKGTTADVAMKEAFGPDMTPYYAGMRDYVKKNLFVYGRIAVAIDLKPEGFSSRDLSPAESATRSAWFLAAMGRPVEARAMAAAASVADPTSPGPSEIEGLLLEREQKTAEAQAAFAKAIERGSKDARIYYRLAQAAFPTGQPADQATNAKIATLLEKAIALEPEFANALSYMAEIRVAMGNPADAVPLAEKAVRIEPDQTYHHVALARALWSAERPQEAMTSAIAGLGAAANEQDQRSARSFMDFMSRSQGKPASTVANRDAEPMPSSITGAQSEGFADREAPEAVAALQRCLVEQVDAACGKVIPILNQMCQEMDGYACRQLGSIYDGGFGVPMDKVKAAAVYMKGCTKAGDTPSCARYAVLQAQGTGVAKDMSSGLATLERLCGEKVDDACIGWAQLLVAGVGERDSIKAKSLLRASCDGGNPEGCRILKTLTKN